MPGSGAFGELYPGQYGGGQLPDLGDYIVQEEDGTSRLVLEEGNGCILLEGQGNFEIPTPGGAIAGGVGPTARASSGTGGAVAGGTAPAGAVPVSRGQAIAGGFAPWDSDAGTAKARVSQVPVEIVVSPDNSRARVSQLAVEVISSPTNAKARVSQLVVEVIYQVPHETISVEVID